ncbi:MAG: 3-hydroxyacyl-CoA dehydrogenase NAD-binding domain-containing protein, partial [Thermaurantiacus sp.]
MKIGIIGAGLMGHGIAQTAAAAGHAVVLTDVNRDRAEAGKAKVEKGLQRLVGKGSMEASAAEALLGRITPADDRAGFSDAGLVIEAATENVELKKRIFADLGGELGPETILATNTSSISITMLASVTDRPDKFVGLHFFNPVPVMKLVEIIPGLATSDDTRALARAFVDSLGKTAIVSEDSPSFIVNRVLCPMLNEAIFALGEGIGSVEDIDTGLKLGANHPMGPLTLADFVGLDTLHAIMLVMLEATGDPKYRPAPLLTKYVEAG